MYFTRIVLCLAVVLSIEACKPSPGKSEVSPMQGTWQLISETKIEKQDTVFSPIPSNQRMIKIINETHFSFLRHDLNNGKDSLAAVFVAGGGTYSYEGGKYKENLEFCNYREWENHGFEFEAQIVGDTLIQKGIEKVEGLGVDRIIIERYVKVTK